MAGRSVEQLKLDYPDRDWQKKFVEICDLIEILADCIIADSYVISDELNAAIKLSESGNNALNRLTIRQSVNPKDARILCALSLGHDDLFLDVDQINIDKFMGAINAGIKKGSIRFPFTYGRALYDAYASLFEEEKEFLTNDETLKLLDILPKGVFQYGPFTVGPYGVQRSPTLRSVPAKRRVPAYHCSRSSCHTIHSVVLQTGNNSSIHRDRSKLTNLLESSKEKASEWWAFAAELSGLSRSYYGDQRAGVLIPLIGDALSDAELRSLVSHLLDNTRGELRDSIKEFSEIKYAAQATQDMDRAQLLQLTLITREELVASALDHLVHGNEILVPKGDIREAIVNRSARSGAFHLYPQLSHYGVRYISDNPGLAMLRVRRLLSSLYVRNLDADVEELEWQLRGINIEDLDEKLEYFFHTRSPAETVERLVLARKTNMVTACHEVGIEYGSELADHELIDALLWKLGFPADDDEDPHRDFWRRHERLWALTQSSAIGNSERFLETAAPYFTGLEGLLLNALAFTSWALLVDHARCNSPFTYDDQDDRNLGLERLQKSRPVACNDDVPEIDYTSERVDLRNLMEGFRVLAKHLDKCRKTPEAYERPPEELPEFYGKTDLKRYLLRSTIPFVDLSKLSQDRIIESLENITSAMVAADVNQVRNEYMHYRRTPPNISRVEKALEATRQSVTTIENLGFCRLLFTPSTVTTDRWGQSMHDFIGPRSYEHTFTRPTTLDWMGLPPLTEPQYLLRAASFVDSNEVLRFTRRYQSEFSEMWKGLPNRRRRGPGAPASEEDPTHSSDVEISSTG